VDLSLGFQSLQTTLRGGMFGRRWEGLRRFAFVSIYNKNKRVTTQPPGLLSLRQFRLPPRQADIQRSNVLGRRPLSRASLGQRASRAQGLPNHRHILHAAQPLRLQGLLAGGDAVQTVVGEGDESA